MSDDTTKTEPNETSELAQAQKQRDEYLAQLQRERADFANYQKRMKTQTELDRAYAVSGLAADLLPVIDNFERATEAARASEGAKSIVDGLELVHKQLLAALAKHGIEPIHAIGEPFDPNLHDAMMQHPSAEHPENTVVMEMSKGYKHRDRVLRPSGVAVSAKPAQ
jgi:molecular chaperone GrpE